MSPLTAAAVVATELAGEFLSLDHDQGIVGHFRRYRAADFPAPAACRRTTFARRVANLYAATKALHAHMARRLAAWDRVFLVDSRPVDACAFGRAKVAERFRGEAAYGHDHTRCWTIYGFRLHVRAATAGAMVVDIASPAGSMSR